MSRLVIPTPSGDAWVDLDSCGGSQLLVIGHGAGGSIDAPDLLSVRAHCLAAGISVARVTQPYRVLGRRAPPAAATLDAAWQAVVTSLSRRRALRDLSVSYGGRSSGARVACRTAAARFAEEPMVSSGGPVRVVALAFPVHPPGKPEKTRLAELDAVPVPTLVVQGAQDPFGMPSQRRGLTLVVVPGDHALKRSADEVGKAVADWLSVDVGINRGGPTG
ncbi:alpha/beta hydrolase [soil metagenome]